jgi:hypothetical protein
LVSGDDSPDLGFAGSPSLRLRRKEGWPDTTVSEYTNPLSAQRREGRRAKQCRGESPAEKAVRLVVITHPIYASLDHPLFAFGGKRVWGR